MIKIEIQIIFHNLFYKKVNQTYEMLKLFNNSHKIKKEKL
jgi:hypothetical protein